MSKHANPEVQFVDSIVERRQIARDQGLSAAEARTDPDTLEAFGDIVEAVQSCDEFVLAYIGVQKNIGQRRKDAHAKVVKVETEIAGFMLDAELINRTQYSKQIERLQDPATIKALSVKFVSLFQSVLPKELLPKTKSKAKSKAKSTTPVTQPIVAETAPEPLQPTPVESLPLPLDVPVFEPVVTKEVVQASRFDVLIDKKDLVYINGTAISLPQGQDVILRTLLHEATDEEAQLVTPSYIKASREWKLFVQGYVGDQTDLFTKQISQLREAMSDLGMANLIAHEGSGRGRAYQALINSLEYVDHVITPEPQAEDVGLFDDQLQPEISDPTAERADTTAADFAQIALAGIFAVEQAQGVSSLKRKDIANAFARNLRITDAESTTIITNLLNTGQLHNAGSKDGYIMISTTEQQPQQGAQTPSLEKQKKTEVWTDEDLKGVELLMERLLTLDHANQSMVVNKIAARPEFEALLGAARTKRLARRLEAAGMVRLELRNTHNKGRRKEAQIIRIGSQRIRDAWKADPREALAQFRAQIASE